MYFFHVTIPGNESVHIRALTRRCTTVVHFIFHQSVSEKNETGLSVFIIDPPLHSINLFSPVDVCKVTAWLVNVVI